VILGKNDVLDEAFPKVQNRWDLHQSLRGLVKPNISNNRLFSSVVHLESSVLGGSEGHLVVHLPMEFEILMIEDGKSRHFLPGFKQGCLCFFFERYYSVMVF